MTDVIDRASELEQKQREQAIAASKAIVEKPQEFNGHRYCLDCDIEINTQRLLANPNAVRCITCQTYHEASEKHFNRRGF